MQKTLAAATLAAVLGMSGGAYAADLSAGGSMKDAPAYVPDTGSWTGFYLGAGVGGAMTNDDLKGSLTKNNNDPSLEVNGLGGEGAFGTVGVGYDRQFGRFVGGVLFDYDFSDITGDFALNVGGTTFKASWTLNDSWSAGGRLGYLVNPSTLAYFLAAYTQAEYSVPSGLQNPVREGVTLGGGLETHLGGNWFLKAEYRFTDLDSVTLFDKNIGNWNVKLTDQADIQSGRLVLSYKADLFGMSHDLTPLK